MSKYYLPAPWDLEYDCLLMDQFKEAGGYWDSKEKLWLISREAEVPDRCQQYELR